MRSRPLFLASLVLACLSLGASLAAGQPGPTPMRRIRGGTFQPFYRGARPEVLRVEPFSMDVHAVTNGEFASFVSSHPEWSRPRIKRLFAENGYLAQWQSDTGASDAHINKPVTRVSWFAAKAYCSALGKRLPTETEWEYVGRADEKRQNASRDRAFVRRLLDWYSRPHPTLPSVMSHTPNVWGVHDMHGVIWEWVYDFNGSLVSSDNRESGDAAAERFCGGAALGAIDTANYAAFMRYAFRSSLHANYVLPNLGFRCVR